METAFPEQCRRSANLGSELYPASALDVAQPSAELSRPMNTAFPFRTRHRVYAVVVASILPGLLAGAILLIFPSGCDERGAPDVYRWTCLLPRLLLLLPMLIAVFLPISGWLNRRLHRPLPDGRLASALITGLATQLAFVASYAMVLDPAYFRAFLAEVVYIPQPFVTGAVTAASYKAALHWFGRRAGMPT